MILVSMRLEDSPAVLRRRFAALRPGLRGVERRLRTATPDLPFPVYPRRPSRAGRGPRRLGLARRCFGRIPAGSVRRLPNAHRRPPVYSGFTSKHRTAHSKAKRRTRSAAHNAGLKMRRHNKSIRRCRTKDKPSGFHKPQRKRRSRHGSALRLGRLADRRKTVGKNLAASFPRAAACRGSGFSAAKQTENAAAIRLCMKPHTQGAG